MVICGTCVKRAVCIIHHDLRDIAKGHKIKIMEIDCEYYKEDDEDDEKTTRKR